MSLIDPARAKDCGVCHDGLSGGWARPCPRCQRHLYPLSTDQEKQVRRLLEPAAAPSLPEGRESVMCPTPKLASSASRSRRGCCM